MDGTNQPKILSEFTVNSTIDLIPVLEGLRPLQYD